MFISKKWNVLSNIQQWCGRPSRRNGMAIWSQQTGCLPDGVPCHVGRSRTGATNGTKGTCLGTWGLFLETGGGSLRGPLVEL